VTQGGVARLCIVLARTGEGKDGVTAFLVDTGSPGYRVTRKVEKLGMRASDTVDIALDGVLVPDSMRLGEVGRGFRDAMQLMSAVRVNLAAVAIGIARGALEAAAAYANERRQFDVPIGSFQMIQWKLANAATELDAARLLTHRAALLVDAGRPCRKEAAMAKLFASEAAVRICSDAIQVHGGYGYTTEFPVERAWRDAKLTTIGEGTSEILRLTIARDVLSSLG
jgi:alkylation response protein AidB-like acyl-CoA dehydrogenase